MSNNSKKKAKRAEARAAREANQGRRVAFYVGGALILLMVLALAAYSLAGV
ncbi:MAG: hypothetical protein ACI3X9_07790 [Bacteroidaceae bacterium]